MVVGLIMALVGFGIAVASLGVTSAVGMRLVMVLVGMAVSLAGILGPLNQSYLKDAIWKK